MTCDLARFAAPLAALVPENPEQSFRFDAASCPAPPASLATDRLHIERGSHAYGDCHRVDVLHVRASKNTYRDLGLLILASLFHPEVARVEVELLDQDASPIRWLILRSIAPRDDAPGYHTLPARFNYWPGEVTRHPWVHHASHPYDLPGMFLGNRDEDTGVRDEDWNGRDAVFGFGSDRGSVRFAELLLDVHRPSCVCDEIELEGEAGFRGVAPTSCEVRLWLPGSLGY